MLGKSLPDILNLTMRRKTQNLKHGFEKGKLLRSISRSYLSKIIKNEAGEIHDQLYPQ